MSSSKKPLICAECSEEIEEHWNYCPQCGDDLHVEN